MEKMCTGPFKSAVHDSKDVPTSNLQYRIEFLIVPI
jgi:hypothetical protein